MNEFYALYYFLSFCLCRDDYDEYDLLLNEDYRTKRNGLGDTNNGVCYFIVGGGSGEDRNDAAHFVLHPTTHELIVSKELDREQRSEYELIIRYFVWICLVI